MPTVTIPTSFGAMDAYLAIPKTDGPWPAVLIVHDALGMTTDLRHQADWLAGADFLALAPNLYHWGSRMRCLFTTLKAVTTKRGRTFEDLEAAHDWVTDRDDCTGKIGVIGYCLGGGFAVLLASMSDYAASSVNYGSVDDPDTVLVDACPIVASYGGRDRSLRKAPQQLETALTTHGIEHDIKVYPDAGHAFLNDHAPGEMPTWARIAGSFANAGYHEPSAIDARQRITSFFDAHLRP